MTPPQLDAFGERELLDSGPCGTVFRAVRTDGVVTAVKLLDGMAINRPLLEAACARLEEGGWPAGVVPVLEADFRTRPAVRVTACLADRQEDGTWRPRSLQHRLDDFPGEGSWEMVRRLTRALAALHARQVAHGNLKPGNVFFDDSGEVALIDWCLGHMPGIANHQFTDAILYQSPEQLRSPEGYEDQRGYRWDVYALGAMAFRLVTGQFPRCHSTFSQVAPEPGTTHRDGIAADLGKIASTVEAQAELHWPESPVTDRERRDREIVERCLALDPLSRPANAMEVERLFQEVESEATGLQAMEDALDQRRRARKAAFRYKVMAGVTLAAAALGFVLWRSAVSGADRLTASHTREMESKQRKLEAATRELGRLNTVAQEATAQLRSGESTWLARLEASRDIGDRLFGWAVEEGDPRLPPLQGRMLRLQRLERFYQSFVDRTAEISELSDERSRALLQLAEISLAMGEPEVAEERFQRALSEATEWEANAGLDLRLATDRLSLAMLLQEKEDPRTLEAFDSARNALKKVPKSQVDADRVDYLLATLELKQSEWLAAHGSEEEALARLLRATEELNRLADQRPEAPILGSELVACYLASANLLDGMGELGDARDLRELASSKLLKLIAERPDDFQLRLELAGCYGAVAESSLIAGDIKRAESMALGATKLLTDLLPMRPDNVLTKVRLAAQNGLLAGILRDRGDSDGAMDHYNEGLRLLEGLTVGENAQPGAVFRYALLTWEKGRMVGFGGDRKAEIGFEQNALGMLADLLETPYGVTRAEQIQRSRGYILGDLGHAAEMSGDKQLSSETFTEAVRLWEELHRERPDSEEYEEALAWNRQRLAEFRPHGP
ncbi:tetratricopeptide (TPR) repeat protein [Haloferula luteola]|uniref:Tetratricopeptide (TPR) repeat protein n=1 Tax=Haloferula luteola TaxID=595692 RepID=A0A840V9H2_9BACT|nr:phosphotransferase [Haloferula luteola]MBB5352234.1 tetratricopeptide (TPR) repeat protein [Haloferula luteola]